MLRLHWSNSGDGGKPVARWIHVAEVAQSELSPEPERTRTLIPPRWEESERSALPPDARAASPFFAVAGDGAV
jgi:hypothetical protein